MPEEQLNDQDLREFLAARISTSERSLLASGRRATPADETTDYQNLVTNVLGRVVASREDVETQRERAQGLLEELLQHPEERRKVLICNSARFRNWHLCTLLAEESLQSGSRQPQRAVHLAELATELTAHLDPRLYPHGVLEDLKARVWACFGNALRKRGELSRATEEALTTAERHLEQGTGDRLEEARLMGLKGALRGDQGRFAECFDLFDQAAAIYHRYGERHMLGQILIKQGIYRGYAGDPKQAIEHFYRSLDVVDTKQEPRLLLAATHNLILNLNQMGRFEEAAELLENSREAYSRFGDRTDLLRLRWLEGRIARSHERFEEAEQALSETREGFIEEGVLLDTALVSLEMAAIYLEQGRTGEIKSLAKEMLPIFKASEYHREALATMILFQKAAEMERVTLSLIQDAMAKISRLRHS